MMTILSSIFALAVFAADKDLKDSEVPTAVKNTLSKNYNAAQHIEWEKKGVFYQAEFRMNRRDIEVLLDEKGNIIKIYEEISSDELPQKVQQAIQSKYAGYRISDVDKITKDGSVLYKVELEHGEHDVDVYFNDAGEIIKMPIH